MIKARDKTYEDFHKSSSIQKKIISPKNFTYRIILNEINNYLEQAKEVLDIGCGVGTLSFYLANKGKEILGIDISEKAIEICRESSKKLELEKKTIFKKMNFPNELPGKRFDLVLLLEVIEHQKKDDLVLKKVFQLLKPGGVVIISAPSKNAPLHKLGLTNEFDKRVGHLRRYELSELKNKCQKVGFKIIATKKTEGIVRNFLYLNPIAGKFIRFIKFFIADLIMGIDKISLLLFGESDLFIIAQKPK